MPPLSHGETAELLEKYGLPYARSFASKDCEALVQASMSYEFPVVLKAISAKAIHKTEFQLVELAIEDAASLRRAFNSLSARALEHGLQELDGFLVQEQQKGVELLVGAKRDSSFGPTVLFGFGGIYAELVKDFAVRVCPIDETQAEEMIFETKAGLFFSQKGFRGKKACKSEVVKMIVRTSKLLLENPKLQEIDFNPVISSANKATIVDARMIVSD